jgi:hypothetical protein
MGARITMISHAYWQIHLLVDRFFEKKISEAVKGITATQKDS